MKSIFKTIKKNKLTSISIILLWAIYFLSWIYLHFGGDIKESVQLWLSIVLSFVFAFIISFLSYINIIFFPKTKRMMRNSKLAKALNKTINIEIEGLYENEFSNKLSQLCVGNFFNALLAFCICYYWEYHFKTFIWLSIIFILINTVSHILVLIFYKDKDEPN